MRVPSEDGAISRNFEPFGDIAFDSEGIATSFSLRNPSRMGVPSASNGQSVIAIQPRASTGDGNLDALRLGEVGAATDVQCGVVNDRVRCTLTRSGTRTQLLRCDSRGAGEPAELFLGNPGTNPGCRPVEPIPVLRDNERCVGTQG